MERIYGEQSFVSFLMSQLTELEQGEIYSTDIYPQQYCIDTDVSHAARFKPYVIWDTPSYTLTTFNELSNSTT